MTKALIRLCGCTGWFAHLLLANPRRQVFSDQGPYRRANMCAHVLLSINESIKLVEEKIYRFFL